MHGVPGSPQGKPPFFLRASPEASGDADCHNELVAVSVLIVDDHPGFRSWARSFLEAEGYVVVGEAGDAASAMSAARELRPDVILLDVQLPDRNGFDIAVELDKEHARVVLISNREAATYRTKLSENPAVGFISKDELSGESLAAMLSG